MSTKMGGVMAVVAIAMAAGSGTSRAQAAQEQPALETTASPASPPPPGPAPSQPNPAEQKLEVFRNAGDCQPIVENRGRGSRQSEDEALAYSDCAQQMLMAGQSDAALNALARSDTIGAARNDPIFEGSIGIRNAMMRAWLLNRTDRRDEAVAEINRVRDRRRYSVIIQWGLDRLLAGFDGGLDRFAELAIQRVPDHPDLLRTLFLVELTRGNLAAALPHATALTLENPRPIGGWTVDGNAPTQALADTSEIHAMRAYVFAANGRGAEARAMLNAIDRDIAEFVGQPPATREGRRPSRRAAEAYAVRVGLGQQIERSIDRWKQAIAARTRLAGGAALTIEQIERDFPGALQTAAALDIARLITLGDAREARERNEALRRIEANLARQVVAVDARTLMALLPEVETLERYPRFGGAGDGILLGRDRGYSQAREDGSDIRTVRFGTVSGSNATADELTLLAAATYAQRDNFDSFILLSRRNLERQMRVIGGYGAGTFDHGSEGQARVVMLNSAALPAEWAAQRHRLIFARDVLASLGARQADIEARRTAAQRRNR